MTNIKCLRVFQNRLIISLCSFSAIAEESHLDQAIKHAEAAVSAADGKAIAKHAGEAKTHANASKSEKTSVKNVGSHLDAGIKSLDEAIKQGNLGATDLAKKAAEQAVTHLKQAA
ncbi:small metal-binding protein SmbP [Nitrosomonas ureae]|uniref:small metal-binding protein SmbP n=1 Tax=Nitrosomonas ureae TaxID=44577 RepID=UPI000CDF078D|nr:small metal-binding protein SmbP [Nitrosomonas ureae]